jgi:transposase
VAVPIDVGKHGDGQGRRLHRCRVGQAVRVPARSQRRERLVNGSVGRCAGLGSLVRVGLEAAGHYHLPLAGGVLPASWELRVLNPGHVAMQRKANGSRGVKTDKIDLTAIADLLLAGKGTIAPPFADPIMTLTGWVAHRRRRSLVRRRTIQQLTTHVDRCFPGLGATMWSVALSKAGRLIISELPTPLGSPVLALLGCGRFAANRDVRMTTPLAEKIVEAARLKPCRSLAQRCPADCWPRPAAPRRCRSPDRPRRHRDRSAPAAHTVRRDDQRTGVGTDSCRALRGCCRRSRTLAQPPPALPSLRPDPSHLRISRPPRDGHISREGSVPLRVALIDLGTGLWHQDPASAAPTERACETGASPAGSSVRHGASSQQDRLRHGPRPTTLGTQPTGPRKPQGPPRGSTASGHGQGGRSTPS